MHLKELGNDHNRPSLLKTFTKFRNVVNQFKNVTPENNNSPEKISPSKY